MFNSGDPLCGECKPLLQIDDVLKSLLLTIKIWNILSNQTLTGLLNAK